MALWPLNFKAIDAIRALTPARPAFCCGADTFWKARASAG